ncbi:hypothetical protein ECH_0915 [Ehrlichia chaffeensis str. Arkansas]|uniref:Uncharacterized protein n=1 Tax=Ehrlichia chaffeensis (strain ATCC CRL-10679 / Arkansas) TaxID=205920 RepID=Q2GFS7_EHRCR|nr:hypothetical protein ECH_0915 [Ehrlichia chaffeensis str. Arkansas]
MYVEDISKELSKQKRTSTRLYKTDIIIIKLTE